MQDATYHSNRYHARAACEHCAGIIRHEKWCLTENKRVFYAYDILINADHLTEQDALILHSLGVKWTPLSKEPCDGQCPTTTSPQP